MKKRSILFHLPVVVQHLLSRSQRFVMPEQMGIDLVINLLGHYSVVMPDISTINKTLLV